MAQNCLTKGMLAGEVLLVVMQMQAPGQTRSVHTACRLLAAAADQRPTVTGGVLSVPNLTTGFSAMTLRSQQTLHEKAWLRYKAVAHLWAAYNLMRNLLLQSGANGFSVVSRSPYEDPDAFLTFLALAEKYRIWGEAFKPHAQRGKSLLDPQTTWSVPAHLILPPLEGRIVPPLRRHLDAILQGYETPFRRSRQAEHSSMAGT
jgi:hypothetical protein